MPLSHRRQRCAASRSSVRRRLLVESLEDRRLMATVGNNISVGESLRVYRTAIAVTGEYTQFFGSADAARAAVEAFVARANQILQVEQAIRLELVDAPQLIYADPATDPYDTSLKSTLLQDNVRNLNSVLSPTSYDVGHLLHAANLGGVASRASVGGNSKAGGVSTAADPTSHMMLDVFLHEVGHQFGAAHSFNSTLDVCGENRIADAAYEPGAGTTLMSYVGKCGADKVVAEGAVAPRDVHYHAASFESIQSRILNAPRFAPAYYEPTGNQPPQVHAGYDYTIPANTPFQITATALDPDQDDLRYSWEQIDRGPPRLLSAPDDGQGPLFRSRPPSPEPTRIFPDLQLLRSGETNEAERLPGTSRQLNFRATVRDGRAGIASDDVMINVQNTGAAFAVASPAGGEVWSGGDTVTVRWDVAGTDAAPIHADRVVIELSADDGQTWPFPLAETNNDGQAEVVLPNAAISQGRVRIRPVDNIFFAFSGPVSIAHDAARPHLRVDPVQIHVTEGGPAEAYELALSQTRSQAVRMRIDGGKELRVSVDGEHFAAAMEIELVDATRHTIWVSAAPDAATEGVEAGGLTHTIVSGDDVFVPGVAAWLPVSIGDDEERALIGVDFQPVGMDVMPGWNEINSWAFLGTRTFSNLQREDGEVTDVSLVIGRGKGTAGAGTASVDHYSAPPHNKNSSFRDLDGLLALTSEEPLELVWRGLEPRTVFEVFVMGLESQRGFELNQTVVITGDGSDDPAPLVQQSPRRDDYLIMNSRPAVFDRRLAEDAVTVTSSAEGEIRISVRGDETIRLAGLALRPAAAPAPGIVVSVPETPLELHEGDQPVEVLVSLAAQPETPVVIRPQAELPDEVHVTPSALTFTAANWRIPQRIQVQAVDDTRIDGAHLSWVGFVVDVAASDAAYAAALPAHLAVLSFDDEIAGIHVSLRSDGEFIRLRNEDSGQVFWEESISAALPVVETTPGDDQIWIDPGISATVHSGVGDDIFDVADLLFRRLDAGAGHDTLVLTTGGHQIDLTAIGDDWLIGFERLDIRGEGSNELAISVEAVASRSGDEPLQIIYDHDDGVTFGLGWKLDGPVAIGGEFAIAISSADARLEVLNDRHWRNPLAPSDVNANGVVEPVDALAVINRLNWRDDPTLPMPRDIDDLSAMFYDVNGNGTAEPLDALLVINTLNRRTRGSGESANLAVASPLDELHASDASEPSWAGAPEATRRGLPLTRRAQAVDQLMWQYAEDEREVGPAAVAKLWESTAPQDAKDQLLSSTTGIGSISLESESIRSTTADGW